MIEFELSGEYLLTKQSRSFEEMKDFMKADTLLKRILFSTVKIETSNDSTSGSGTGFFYTAERDGIPIPLIVTNKHVIEGATRGGVKFHVTNDPNGQGAPLLQQAVNVTAGEFESLWFGHPDPGIDVAVMSAVPFINTLKQSGRHAFYRSLTRDLSYSSDGDFYVDAVETVTFVGYPTGLMDSFNNTPIVRQGITATPVQLDWEGKPVFLIDASVFPGSSGSPVFVIRDGLIKTGPNSTSIGGSQIFFLGIVAAGYETTRIAEKIKPEKKCSNNSTEARIEEEGSAYQQLMNLGIVFKSSTVEEAANGFIDSCTP